MSEHDMARQIDALRLALSRCGRALMVRVQLDNDCALTGVDCRARAGGKPCSCTLEARNEVENAPDVAA